MPSPGTVCITTIGSLVLRGMILSFSFFCSTAPSTRINNRHMGSDQVLCQRSTQQARSLCTVSVWEPLKIGTPVHKSECQQHADWPVIAGLRISRMKTLGYALRLGTSCACTDARAETGLRELIAEAEQRLEQLEARRRTKASTTNSPNDCPLTPQNESPGTAGAY